MNIKIKRVYEEPSDQDGIRLLVDRLWPRGIKKEHLLIDAWLKDLAPSSQLRKWFNHDPSRLKDFEKKYAEELESNKDIWKPELAKYAHQKITLLYAAKDPHINHALCLKSYLQKLKNHERL